jgi:hypothetical protein
VSLGCLVFAKHEKVFDERRDGIDALSVSDGVIIGDINIEEVFPFVTDDRQGLYLREVDMIEGEDGKHM